MVRPPKHTPPTGPHGRGWSPRDFDRPGAHRAPRSWVRRGPEQTRGWHSNFLAGFIGKCFCWSLFGPWKSSKLLILMMEKMLSSRGSPRWMWHEIMVGQRWLKRSASGNSTTEFGGGALLSDCVLHVQLERQGNVETLNLLAKARSGGSWTGWFLL